MKEVGSPWNRAYPLHIYGLFCAVIMMLHLQSYNTYPPKAIVLISCQVLLGSWKNLSIFSLVVRIYGQMPLRHVLASPYAISANS